MNPSSPLIVPRRAAQRTEKFSHRDFTSIPQFSPAQEPEGSFRLKRPFWPEPAAQQFFVVGVTLGNSGYLQVAPTAAENFDIVIIPAAVRFVRPALLFQFSQDGGNESQPIDRRISPILDFAQRHFAVAQGQGINGLLNRKGSETDAQAALVSGPAAHNRLQKEEQRNQRAGPPANFFSRQRSLDSRRRANPQGRQETGRSQRQQPGKVNRKDQQR